jgi:hypothetical protein
VASRTQRNRKRQQAAAKPVSGQPRDKLNRKQLQALYGVTAQQLKIDDGLYDVFQRAWKGGWEGEQGRARFWAEIEKTDWWRTNSKYMREYLFQAADPQNVDFQMKKTEAEEFVRRRAMSLGVNIGQDRIAQLAEQSLMMGWGEQGRTIFLDRQIIEGGSQDGVYGGDIQANRRALAALARANGVRYADNWFLSAGKSIAGGLSESDFWENQIRESAAGLFPAFREQIESGVNMMDVASPYFRMMVDEWEVSPDNLTLDNQSILTALGRYDDKGKPTPMNLGEFRTMLRRDPRWMNTARGQNEVSSVASRVLQMFGLSN